MWAVMKAVSWESLNCDNINLVEPKIGEGQPQRFIPLFDERSDAEKFAGEDEKHLIAEMRPI